MMISKERTKKSFFAYIIVFPKTIGNVTKAIYNLGGFCILLLKIV